MTYLCVKGINKYSAIFTHLAQMVEHGSYEPRVVGSSPTLSICRYSSVGRACDL